MRYLRGAFYFGNIVFVFTDSPVAPFGILVRFADRLEFDAFCKNRNISASAIQWKAPEGVNPQGRKV